MCFPGRQRRGRAGIYTITFTAHNGVGTDATQYFVLTVATSSSPAITSVNSTAFSVGVSGSFTVTATGVPTPTLSESGSLPSGVSFNTSTGVLSGTPASGTNGSYSVTFTASNGVGSNATQTFTLTVGYLGAYSYSRAITIPHTNVVGSDQSNFPVLISGTYSIFATTSNAGYVTNSNGYDIVFASDSAGVNRLAFEQQTYTASNGKVTYWVKIPTLSHTVDTTFYVFFGNSSVTTDQSDKTDVWSGTYSGVWHLENGSTLSPTDSTSNGNNGTVHSATATAGQINGAANFNGSSQYVDLGTISALQPSGAVSVSAWVKPGTTQLQYPQIVANSNSTGLDGYGLYLYNYDYASFTLNVGGSFTYCFAEGAAINDNNWHYVVGTYAGAGGAVTMYVDNYAPQTSTCPNSATTYGSSPATEIGWKLDHGSNDDFNGVIDEVRISPTVLSGSRIATEYLSQSSPSTFFSMESPTRTAYNHQREQHNFHDWNFGLVHRHGNWFSRADTIRIRNFAYGCRI